MRTGPDIDDLHGDAVMAAFVEDVRAYASGPPPALRPELAAILASGIGGAGVAHVPPVDVPAPPPPPVHRRLRDRLQSRPGRVALGASVLSLTVFGTGGAGALPGPAQEAFERTVEVVGIELPDEVAGERGPAADAVPEPPADVRGPDNPDDDVARPPAGDGSSPAPAAEAGPAGSVPGGAADAGGRSPEAPGGAAGAGGRPPGVAPGGPAGVEVPPEARERMPDRVPGPPVEVPGPPGGVPVGPRAGDRPGGPGGAEPGGGRPEEAESEEDESSAGEGVRGRDGRRPAEQNRSGLSPARPRSR